MTSPQASSPQRAAPWNPYQIFSFFLVISTIGVAIILSINWGRLGRAQWRLKSALLCAGGGVVASAIMLAWVAALAPNPRVPMQLLMLVPFLALGFNLGSAWALARVQNGGYKAFKSGGRPALERHEYDIRGAVYFGASVMLAIAILASVLAPLLA